MPQAPLSAVFFDAAETLFTLREAVGTGYSSVASRFGFELDPEATEAAFRREWTRSSPESTGSPLPDDGKGWWRDLVFRILDSLEGGANLPPRLREDYFEALYQHYASPEQWTLFPETRELLEILRHDHPGLILAVVSNFDQRLHGVLAGLGIGPIFDQVVISSEVGYAKPHEGIFQAALWRCGLPPGTRNCIHVGNDPIEDWEGARQAGFPVLELRRPENDLRSLLDLLPT